MVTWSTYSSLLDRKYNTNMRVLLPRSVNSKHDNLHLHISISIQNNQLQ